MRGIARADRVKQSLCRQRKLNFPSEFTVVTDQTSRHSSRSIVAPDVAMVSSHEGQSFALSLTWERSERGRKELPGPPRDRVTPRRQDLGITSRILVKQGLPLLVLIRMLVENARLRSYLQRDHQSGTAPTATLVTCCTDSCCLDG
jgi:hypothetical protein